jgi:hypothetical protein
MADAKYNFFETTLNFNGAVAARINQKEHQKFWKTVEII